MADERFTADETRKLAVLIARIWANPQLESDYKRDPEAVLWGAGVNLGGRAMPQIPEKPAELAAQNLVAAAEFASASSFSTVTCPCTAFTGSCHVTDPSTIQPQVDALMKLAEDPAGREQARKLVAGWDLKLGIQPPRQP